MELVRYLTIGSINRYRLRGRTATDPTVNPLIGPGFMGKPRTICEYTRFSVYVKPLVQIIFGALCMPVQIADRGPGGPVILSPYRRDRRHEGPGYHTIQLLNYAPQPDAGRDHYQVPKPQ